MYVTLRNANQGYSERPYLVLYEGGHSWTLHLVLFVADRDRHLPGELSDPSRVQ